MKKISISIVMKYIDFIIQTGLILFSAGVLLVTLQNNAWPATLLIPQFFVGVWQMISSIVSVLFKMRAYHLKRWHLFFAGLYLVCLSAWPSVSLTFLIVPSWLLATYYYIVTCVTTFARQRKNGSFLPHLSF
jgi:hypothetical protein